MTREQSRARWSWRAGSGVWMGAALLRIRRTAASRRDGGRRRRSRCFCGHCGPYLRHSAARSALARHGTHAHGHGTRRCTYTCTSRALTRVLRRHNRTHATHEDHTSGIWEHARARRRPRERERAARQARGGGAHKTARAGESERASRASTRRRRSTSNLHISQRAGSALRCSFAAELCVLNATNFTDSPRGFEAGAAGDVGAAVLSRLRFTGR